MKFGRDFAGHRQKQIRIKTQFMGKSDGGGFAGRRFQTPLDLGEIGRFNADATRDLSQRIAARIRLSQFGTLFT